MRRVNPLDWRERLMLSPTDIADALSIGLTQTYALAASGAFGRVMKIGRSVRVETERVIEWSKLQRKKPPARTDGSLHGS